jgi:2,3-dihydroxy-p-cumate/2,3-dihydroxybenzoate 3,4-dioxygenase
VVASPQFEQAAAYLTDTLNFRISDRIANIAAFTRPYPNPFHHGIGMVRGDRHRMHHLNFMVSEIDDIGRAMARFRKHDVPIVFGPGRHPPSESIFLYFLDPDGLTLEYSFGMEEFPAVGAREPRTLPTSPESIDCWGSQQDPRCGTRGEIA